MISWFHVSLTPVANSLFLTLIDMKPYLEEIENTVDRVPQKERQYKLPATLEICEKPPERKRKRGAWTSDALHT
jgi:hypothetical protein